MRSCVLLAYWLALTIPHGIISTTTTTHPRLGKYLVTSSIGSDQQPRNVEHNQPRLNLTSLIPVKVNLVLDCPAHHADRFISTTWYIVESTGVWFGLYRIDENNIVRPYRNAENPLIVDHSVSTNRSLVVRVKDCSYVGHYKCDRSAHVGHRNEDYGFHVANCTVTNDSREQQKRYVLSNARNKGFGLVNSIIVIIIAAWYTVAQC